MTHKKYACNRLYLPDGRYLSQSVVVLGDEGRVNGYSPLIEETSATEWIGGVIVLSAKEALVPHQEFQDFLHGMTGKGQSLYAWHIAGFDFQREEFIPSSIIRRL